MGRRVLFTILILLGGFGLVWWLLPELQSIAHADTIPRPPNTLPDGCVDTVANLRTLHPEFAVPDPVDSSYLVVLKSARRIMVFDGDRMVRGAEGAHCYPIALAYLPPVGTKRRQGDLKTPEGWYRTSDKPWSKFPHAIAVHYPNSDDAQWALSEGVIGAKTKQRIDRAIAAKRKPPQNTTLGGEILVHGDGGLHDWTLGCVGMENTHIEALRAALPSDMRTWVAILP
ncbi:MAG: L,D-transpeptidase family protein [Myxococcota bacterium]